MSICFEHLAAKLDDLASLVEFDVNGHAGQGGNGGLVNDQTLRCAQEAKLLLSRWRLGTGVPSETATDFDKNHTSGIEASSSQKLTAGQRPRQPALQSKNQTNVSKGHQND